MCSNSLGPPPLETVTYKQIGKKRMPIIPPSIPQPPLKRQKTADSAAKKNNNNRRKSKKKRKTRIWSLMEIPYQNRKKHIISGYSRNISSTNIVAITNLIDKYADLKNKYNSTSIKYDIINIIDNKMSELGDPLSEYFADKKNRSRPRAGKWANCFTHYTCSFDGDQQNFLDIFGKFVDTKKFTKTGYSINLKVAQFCEALGRDWKWWWYKIYPSNSKVGIRLDSRTSWTVKFDVYTQKISFSGGVQNTGPYM